MNMKEIQENLKRVSPEIVSSKIVEEGLEFWG